MSRRAVFWSLLLLIVLCGSVRAQSLSINAALELSQNYRPQCWQPVRVELRNDSDRVVAGTVVLPLDDPNAPAVMQLPVSVHPHARVTTTVWGYFPRITPTAQQRKRGEIPPLSTVEWRGPDGALLSRSQVLGFPLTGPSGEASASETGQMILVVNQRPEMFNDAYEPEQLLSVLPAAVRIVFAAVARETFTREPGALQSFKAIILEGVDPESFDLGQ